MLLLLFQKASFLISLLRHLLYFVFHFFFFFFSFSLSKRIHDVWVVAILRRKMTSSSSFISSSQLFSVFSVSFFPFFTLSVGRKTISFYTLTHIFTMGLTNWRIFLHAAISSFKMELDVAIRNQVQFPLCKPKSTILHWKKKRNNQH